jgi:3-deoxy-D-manno-octulosonic-acid transferase
METDSKTSFASHFALAAYGFAANLLLLPALLLAAPFLRFNRNGAPRCYPGSAFSCTRRSNLAHRPRSGSSALSVGELLSAVPFLQTLKPQLGARPLVVSVSTVAAHQLAESRLQLSPTPCSISL